MRRPYQIVRVWGCGWAKSHVARFATLEAAERRIATMTGAKFAILHWGPGGYRTIMEVG